MLKQILCWTLNIRQIETGPIKNPKGSPPAKMLSSGPNFLPPRSQFRQLVQLFHQTLFSFVLGAKDSGRGFTPLFSHGPKDFFGRRSFTSVSLILRQFCPFWCDKSFFGPRGPLVLLRLDHTRSFYAFMTHLSRKW